MVLLRDPEAVAAVAAVQRELHGLAGLELHAEHFLHISVQSCGFDDALSIDAQRVQAALDGLAPFDVVLGGVNAFHSAVFVEAHSGGRLLALRTALRETLGPAIAAIDEHPGLLFHLTIGYLTPDADVGQVRQAIAPLRHIETARVAISSLELADVPTDQRVPFPRLAPTATFRLGR